MEFISQILQALVEFSNSIGYWGILLLMTIESSFVPFPSELVIPPAAYLAAQGQMNIWLVIVFGILGSLIGATINYYLAYFLGRPLVYELVTSKWAKLFLLSERKLHKAEGYFLKYGNISTFIGRLIFGVRQLISLPAGFVKMPFKAFVFYTFLGSGVWIPILAMHGYLIGDNKAFFEKYLMEICLGLFVLAVIGLAIYFLIQKRRRRN
jgi:membrane protein DedA with SNARE-associated domain